MHYRQPASFVIICITLAMMGLYGCNKTGQSNESLTNQIKVLQKQVEDLKPGFGDVMVDIQLHHAKLWFAGTAKNWELADFEINEVKENVDKIKALYPDDPRTPDLSRLDAPLDSLEAAGQANDVERFRKDFNMLTQTCNGCHQDNGYAFNVITIPNQPPVPNQRFQLN